MDLSHFESPRDGLALFLFSTVNATRSLTPRPRLVVKRMSMVPVHGTCASEVQSRSMPSTASDFLLTTNKCLISWL